MRFASLIVYLALALLSLFLATNCNDVVSLVFAAGGGSITPGIAGLALLALVYRVWFIATFVECLARCAQKQGSLAALSFRVTSVTQLWMPNRVWIWGLLAGEALYERGFSASLVVGFAIQGVFLILEKKFGKRQALWKRLPSFFGGVMTLFVLMMSLLFIRSATLEQALLLCRALIGQNTLYETALLLSAQLSIDFNVVLMLLSTVLVFVAPPLPPLVEPLRRWKVIASGVIIALFVSIGVIPSLHSHVQGWMANGLGKGSSDVVPGHGGWLFDQRELQSLTGVGPLESDVTQPHAPQGSAKDAILDFARQLKERGIPLLLIPLPMKVSLYPEALTNADIDDSPAPLYHPAQVTLYEQLVNGGIDVQDITAAMMQWKARHKEVFFKQDSHWTPEMMQEIAKGVAAHVRKKYPGIVPADPLIVDIKAPDHAFIGDLAHALYRVPEVVTAPESMVLVSFPDLKTDTMSPITLLGDDFASIYQEAEHGFVGASFIEHLALYLGTRIDAVASPDGTSALKTFANRFDDEVRAKKLVIWLVPARDLLSTSNGGKTWSLTPFNPHGSPPKVIEPMLPKR